MNLTKKNYDSEAIKIKLKEKWSRIESLQKKFVCAFTVK